MKIKRMSATFLVAAAIAGTVLPLSIAAQTGQSARSPLAAQMSKR